VEQGSLRRRDWAARVRLDREREKIVLYLRELYRIIMDSWKTVGVESLPGRCVHAYQSSRRMDYTYIVMYLVEYLYLGKVCIAR
jgi:hypothetical protein